MRVECQAFVLLTRHHPTADEDLNHAGVGVLHCAKRFVQALFSELD
jgi:hypothetical protein